MRFIEKKKREFIFLAATKRGHLLFQQVKSFCTLNIFSTTAMIVLLLLLLFCIVVFYFAFVKGLAFYFLTSL